MDTKEDPTAHFTALQEKAITALAETGHLLERSDILKNEQPGSKCLK